MDTTRIARLKPLLARHGFRFNKRWGQNFLIDARAADRIVESARLDTQTGVLEIGPGAGALTMRLAERAGFVAALELDRRLPPLLAEVLSGTDNAAVIQGDVLKTDVAALCREYLPYPRVAAVANLPYYITKPAIHALLDAGCFHTLVMMVQKEVVARLTAQPGDGALTAFSVLVQLRTSVEPLFEVGAGCFMPSPRVESAVVRFCPAGNTPSSLCVELVKAGFAQRRKTLRNALAIPAGGEEAAETLLRTAGIDPDARAEQLSAAQWRALAGGG